MEKLLVIYNFAQKYREGIFKEINNTWECRWIFGVNNTDIKEMDLSKLSNVRRVNYRKLIGPYKIQLGIYKEFKKREFNKILMLGDPYNLSMWLILISNHIKFNKKKIYMWSHGWYGKESFIRRIIKRIFFGLADKTFLYGNYAKQIALKQKFPENKLEVIHNSLDYKEQICLRKSLKPSSIYIDHFKNNYPNIIFIGRLTAVKRLDFLIDAIRILNKYGEKYNVVFVGDGEMKTLLENVVKSSGLENQFWFYGACYDDNTNAQLIYDADLCVAPGNVGLTAMHSMVFGTPVISHNNFALQMPEFEAIHKGKTGDFYEYDNIESLANTISKWFKYHKNDRDRIRFWCYEEIDNFWTPEYQMKVLSSIL